MEEQNSIYLEILEKLNKIEEKLEIIQTDINNIKKSTLNMDTHISFVETVYDTVKNPFYYIMNKIQPIQIKDKNTKEPKMITE